MAFADGPTGQLYHRDLGQLDAVPIPGTENAWYPFFSPDGEWVGYFDRGDDTLKKTRLDGGAAQTLVSVPGGTRSAGWGSDGTIVLRYPRLDGLSRVRDTGGEMEHIANTEGPTLYWLDLLPDGRAVLAHTVGAGDRQVVVVSLETGERTTLFPGTTPRYVSTDHVVFWREDALWAVRFDPDRLTAIGQPTPIVEDVPAESNGRAYFAVGGDLLLYREGGEQGSRPLWLSRGGSEQVLNPALMGLRSPAVSPNGRQIAFEYIAAGEAEDIGVYNVDQQTFSRITFGGSRNLHPFWSPDGDEVGFSSNRDGFFALYSRPPDLSVEARLLFADPDDGLYEGSWTPDGRGLVFRRGSTTTSGNLDLVYAAPDPGQHGCGDPRHPGQGAEPIALPRRTLAGIHVRRIRPNGGLYSTLPGSRRSEADLDKRRNQPLMGTQRPRAILSRRNSSVFDRSHSPDRAGLRS